MLPKGVKKKPFEYNHAQGCLAAPLIPLAITDDRTYGEDWEELKNKADLVVSVHKPKRFQK
jgi:hypothetical protein